MNRRKPLQARTGLKRTAGLSRAGRLERSAGLAPVSTRRQQENRERRAMVVAKWPDGQPQCEWPECPALADDVHEPLTRARRGSICDKENAKALCRPHHDWLTFTPESELGEAYALGFLVHSWDAPKGNTA